MATARRDQLLELQARAQKKWAEEKTFEVTAPRDGELPSRACRAHAPASLPSRDTLAVSCIPHRSKAPLSPSIRGEKNSEKLSSSLQATSKRRHIYFGRAFFFWAP